MSVALLLVLLHERACVTTISDEDSAMAESQTRTGMTAKGGGSRGAARGSVQGGGASTQSPAASTAAIGSGGVQRTNEDAQTPEDIESGVRLADGTIVGASEEMVEVPSLKRSYFHGSGRYGPSSEPLMIPVALAMTLGLVSVDNPLGAEGEDAEDAVGARELGLPNSDETRGSLLIEGTGLGEGAVSSDGSESPDAGTAGSATGAPGSGTSTGAGSERSVDVRAKAIADAHTKAELVKLAEKEQLTVTRSDGKEGEPLESDYARALAAAGYDVDVE